MTTPLEKFEKADCKLYRTPPLDLSSISLYLDNFVADSWQAGRNADSTLERAMYNPEITSALTDKISRQLNFQKEQKMKHLERKKSSVVGTYQAEKEELREKVEAKVEAVATSTKTELEEAEKHLEEQKSTYLSAREKLAELRAEINNKYKDFGGQEGYELLKEINLDIVSEPEKKQETEGRVRKRTPRKKKEENLEDKVAEKPGIFKRIWKKIYEIATYEVW